MAALVAVVALALAFAAVLAPSPVGAASASGAVISDGTVQLGINNLGDLNYNCAANEDSGCPPTDPNGGGDVVGIRYQPLNLDAISPGCPCEGWGVADAGSGLSGYADESTGDGNVTLDSFSAPSSSEAVSTVTIANSDIPGYQMRVTQDYHPSALTPDLFEDDVTVVNTGDKEVADLRYRRAMDWDIEPTAFNEWVTIEGTSPQLLFDSDDGFASADPLSGPAYIDSPSVCGEGYTGSCQFKDLGRGGTYPTVTEPDDHGALFDFGFGKLAVAATRTFTVLYGAAPSETDALSALSTAGAQVYSLGESNCQGATVEDCDADDGGDGGGARPAAANRVGDWRAAVPASTSRPAASPPASTAPTAPAAHAAHAAPAVHAGPADHAAHALATTGASPASGPAEGSTSTTTATASATPSAAATATATRPASPSAPATPPAAAGPSDTASPDPSTSAAPTPTGPPATASSSVAAPSSTARRSAAPTPTRSSASPKARPHAAASPPAGVTEGKPATFMFGFVTTVGDLSITGSGSPEPATVGQNLTYDFTIKNNGPQAATGVTMDDPLPSGVTFVSATPDQGTCAGTTTVDCDIGSLGLNATTHVKVVVKPTEPGPLTNTATVASVSSDANSSNNSATVDSTVLPAVGADVQLSKTASPTSVDLGKNVTYHLTATDNGPDAAAGVTVTDPLPTGTTLVSADTDQGTCNDTSPVMCDIGGLDDGASAHVTIVVTTTRAGTISNTATVSADTTDPVPGNNSATATVTVRAADLSITKKASPTHPDVGSKVTYTLRATDNGPSDATAVQVTDTLPSGLSFVSVTPGTGTCSGTSTITCDLGDVTADSTQTVTIVVRTTMTGTIVNSCQVGSDTPDPDKGNNTASATITVSTATSPPPSSPPPSSPPPSSPPPSTPPPASPPPTAPTTAPVAPAPPVTSAVPVLPVTPITIPTNPAQPNTPTSPPHRTHVHVTPTLLHNRLHLSAPSVNPGGTLTASGFGCPAGSRVVLAVNRKVAGKGRATSSGRFLVKVSAPRLPTGSYRVTATCGGSQLVTQVSLVYVTGSSAAPAAQGLTVAAMFGFFLLLLGLVLRRPTITGPR